MEIWNYMSEFKSYVDGPAKALLGVYAPKIYIRGPYPETLAKWDELLAREAMWAIAGSDAHGTTYRLGPLKRQVFGYEHLFAALNTHILVTETWSGNVEQDAQLVYGALAGGKCFVGYDGLAPTRGFRFWAEHDVEVYTMGDELLAECPVRFCVQAPHRARLRLLCNGTCVTQTTGTELIHTSRSPGAYRVECHRRYLLRPRGWIYSNPILVRSPSGQVGG